MENRKVLSGRGMGQCRGVGVGLVMQETSGAFGRPVVKSVWQVEMRMEREQHQRVHTDSDHRSAHIPLYSPLHLHSLVLKSSRSM